MKKRMTSILDLIRAHSRSFAVLRLSSQRGVALILTLAILVLVTMLMIAFAVSMRVENMASKNFNDAIKARELANAAVDQAVATIRNATLPRTQTPFSTYVTFPGVVYDYNGTPPATPIPLYTVNAAAMFDLNNASSIVAINAEFTPIPKINAGWVYVGQNPAQALGPLNPIIGRYAFWVDDEASKVNINQAWTRGALNTSVIPDTYSSANATYGDTSEVDLSALLPNLGLAVLVGEIQAQRPPTSPNPYATIEEVRRADSPYNVSPILPANFQATKFYLTTFSDDAANGASDLDVFGRQRLALSGLTKANDIDDMIGANSAYTRLADPNLMKVCAAGGVVNAFADPAKYGVNGLKQIIANIIAYRIDPTTTAPPDAGGTPPAYLGLARTPYINEVQIKYEDVGDGTVKRTVSVELFYPYSADGPYKSGPLGSEDTIVVSGLPTVGVAGTTFVAPGFTAGPFTITIPAGTTFNAGMTYFVPPPYVDTATLVLPGGAGPWTALAINIGNGLAVRANYYRGTGAGLYRLDYAQAIVLALAGANALNIPWVAPGPPWAPGTPVWHGTEVNDPCVNETGTSWTRYNHASATPGTLGLPNLAYAPPGGDASKMRMRGGQMLSIGELGFIHTPNSWTYLKLQPGGGGGGIPDWAMLDIFTVGGATAGRININSLIDANNPAFVPPTRRLVPLIALLNKATTWLVDPTLTTVAQNIYDRTYSVGDTFGNVTAYDTIGEICEVKGLADGAILSEADREAAIRRIANLITVRSNTFTIWVIAQSIKQPPNATIGTFTTGVDLITGEVRAQAVVERYEQPIGTGPFFRTKYFRYIYE